MADTRGRAAHSARVLRRRAKDAGASAFERPPRGKPASPGASAAQFTRHGWAIACALIFAAAFVWRMLYLGRLSQTPLSGDLILDSREYWNWASALRAGGTPTASPYFLGPLYPTWLWLIRSLLGDQVQRVLIVQAVLGAASAALLADAARRLTRPAIGIAIGLLAALYQMSVFFDGLVLMESTLWTLSALLLWWVCASEWASAGAARFGALGAVIGLLAQGRAIALVLFAPALLLLPWRGAARGRTLRCVAAMAAAFALVATPAAIHNYRASREWIPFTYNFGYNFYIGFNPEATGTDVTVTGTQAPTARAGDSVIGATLGDGREYLRASEHVELRPAESSAYWAHQATRYIAAHPAHAAWLYGRKLAMLWNAHEYPQVENADEYRQLAGPLGAPLFGEFAFAGVLAVTGLIRVRRGGRPAWFIAGYCAAISLAIGLFFVTDRYRHQLVPGALLLAALGIESLVDAWYARSRPQLLRLALMIALGLSLVNLPVPKLSGAKYEWGLAEDLGRRWLAAGRADLAVAQYQRAIALERSGRVHFEGGATGAMERMQLYFNYGNALARLDRIQEAVPWYERAVELAPDHAEAAAALAGAYRRLGRQSEAAQLESHIGAVAGGQAALEKQQAWQAASAGEFARAESLFTATLAHDANQFDAWGGLIRLQIQRRDLSAARGSLARARSLGMPSPSADGYRALLDALSGNTSGARALLAGIPQRAIDADATLAEVVALARKLAGP